jgi:hypothetical protein
MPIKMQRQSVIREDVCFAAMEVAVQLDGGSYGRTGRMETGGQQNQKRNYSTQTQAKRALFSKAGHYVSGQKYGGQRP